MDGFGVRSGHLCLLYFRWLVFGKLTIQIKMKTIQFKKRFFWLFKIEIYSEDRYNNVLYKHFVSIFFLNYRIFHTFWRTGTKVDREIYESSFYYKGEYYQNNEKIS